MQATLFEIGALKIAKIRSEELKGQTSGSLCKRGMESRPPSKRGRESCSYELFHVIDRWWSI